MVDCWPPAKLWGRLRSASPAVERPEFAMSVLVRMF